MLKVVKVSERNRTLVVDYTKSDIIKHVFAFYDIQHDLEHTNMHVAFQNKDVIGYILTYTGTDVPSVVLESKENVAQTLIRHAPDNHFIMHTTPNLLSIAKERFPSAKQYLEDWMLVKKDQANFFSSRFVKRLRTKEDAALLAQLVLNRKDRPKRRLERYIKWITTMPVYGIFKDNHLVSYAGSFIQLPQVWMIGGVYTDPKHRNKGYAALGTSAITKEALDNAESAALFVRSDNYPAIKVYGKIGYKKIGTKLWLDVGTGLKP